MADSRTKHTAAPRVAQLAAADAFATWGLPATAAAVAVLAGVLGSLELVNVPAALAVLVLATLVLVLDRAFVAPSSEVAPALRGAVAVVWLAACYSPFHALFFPGAALHDPITVRGSAPAVPTAIPTGGRARVDILLEGELPVAPGGGMAIPVQFTIVLEDTEHAKTVLSGRFDDTLRAQRLGRRGTATVRQAHHATRGLVPNPTGGDLMLTAVTLEPAAGAAVTLTAFPHPLPSTPVLAVLATLLVVGAVVVDARLVPGSNGALTLATTAVIGAAVALWTSNTVHPSVTSLIGSVIFGGPLGLGLGALAWAIARRTLVRARR